MSNTRERFGADKADYIRQNLDREEWTNKLDTELFAEFVEFYDAHLQ